MNPANILGSLVLSVALLAAASGVQAAQASRIEQFHLAISDGDLKTVNRLIAAGIDVNEALDGHPPLFVAVAKNRMEIVGVLLRNGADPNAVIDPGDAKISALHYAVKTNNAALVGMLVDAGANPEVGDLYGSTPLLIAAREGYAGVTETLLAGGARVDGRDNKERTPLHWAAFFGQEKTVALLIAHNADVEAVSSDGYTPIAAAKRKGHEDVIRLLREAGARK